MNYSAAITTTLYSLCSSHQPNDAYKLLLIFAIRRDKTPYMLLIRVYTFFPMSAYKNIDVRISIYDEVD